LSGRSLKSFVPAQKGFPKNPNSNDHFDCPFLFLAMKGRSPNMNPLAQFKKYQFYHFLSHWPLVAVAPAGAA